MRKIGFGGAGMVLRRAGNRRPTESTLRREKLQPQAAGCRDRQ